MKAGVGYIAFFGFIPYFGLLPVLSPSKPDFSSTSIAIGSTTACRYPAMLPIMAVSQMTATKKNTPRSPWKLQLPP